MLGEPNNCKDGLTSRVKPHKVNVNIHNNDRLKMLGSPYNHWGGGVSSS
jgi:hypothetical protein